MINSNSKSITSSFDVNNSSSKEQQPQRGLFIRNSAIDKKLARFKKKKNQSNLQQVTLVSSFEQNRLKSKQKKKQSLIDMIQSDINSQSVEAYQIKSSNEGNVSKPSSSYEKYYNFNLQQSKPTYQHLFKNIYDNQPRHQSPKKYENQHILLNNFDKNQQQVKVRRRFGSICKQKSKILSIQIKNHNFKQSEAYNQQIQPVSSRITHKQNQSQQQELAYKSPFIQQKKSHIKQYHQNQVSNLSQRQMSKINTKSTQLNSMDTTIQKSNIQRSNNRNNMYVHFPQYLNKNKKLVESSISENYNKQKDYQNDLFQFVKNQIINLTQENIKLNDQKQSFYQLFQTQQNKNKSLYYQYKKLRNSTKLKYNKTQQSSLMLKEQINLLRDQIQYYKQFMGSIQSSISLKLKKQDDFYFKQIQKYNQIKFVKQSHILELKQTIQNKQKTFQITPQKLKQLIHENKLLSQELKDQTKQYNTSFRQYITTQPAVKYLQKQKQKQFDTLFEQLNRAKHIINEAIKAK